MNNRTFTDLSTPGPVNMIPACGKRIIVEPPGKYVLPPDRATESSEPQPELTHEQ